MENTHVEQKNTLTNFYLSNLQSKCKLQLSKGFNILFYGVGSKKDLIEQIVSELTKKEAEPVLIVNGFFPNLSIKVILTILCEFLNIESTGSPFVSFEKIKQKFEENQSSFDEPKSLIFVLHNIDAVSFRNDQAQHILSLLASLPCIKFISSLENHSTCMFWSSDIASNFNWLFHNITNFQSYELETRDDLSLLRGTDLGSSKTRGVQGVLTVLLAVTEKAKGTFVELAKYQLSHPSEPGLTQAQLLRKCQNKFFAPTNEVLRAHLTEFFDHNMVGKKIDTGVEYLYCTLNPLNLKLVVDQLNHVEKLEN